MRNLGQLCYYNLYSIDDKKESKFMKKIIDYIIFVILKNSIDFLFGILPAKQISQNLLANTVIVGHRGINGNKKFKENTMTAFKKAVQSGCKALELDLQLTKDNIIVINHDKDLTRIHKLAINICDNLYSDIKKDCQDLISLEEFLDYFKDKNIILFLEIKKQLSAEKDRILADQVNKFIGKYNLQKQTKIISLNYNLLIEYYQVFKLEIFPIYLFSPQIAVKTCLENNMHGVFGAYLFTSKKTIMHLQKQKKVIGLGFVNYANTAYRLIRSGTRYIFTDNPVKLLGKLS